MTKRRFRIDAGRYGGELVIGEVNHEFVKKTIGMDEEELVETVLSFDDWEEPEENENEEHEDPESVCAPKDDYYMWECDDIEHMNGAHADGGFFIYEVPADGSDDFDYEKEVATTDGICMYGREGGIFGDDEPELICGDDEDGNHYVPVLAFFSQEKGNFGSWFVETDGEDFDKFKLGFGICETNIAELVDRVYYDKVELDTDYDNNDTSGKSYHAQTGWINMKWHDDHGKYNELDADYLQDFDDNAEYEKEQAEDGPSFEDTDAIGEVFDNLK